jgi:hypothetical protein
VTLRFLPIIFAAVTVGGCATATIRQPVATPFAGTWYQMPKENNREPSGFLAISDDRLLFNLDGLPRGSISIAHNDTDVGLRSGRLIGADGRVLYIAVAETISEQQAGNQRLYVPTVHLDVHWFALGAGPSDQPTAVLRLWPSTALAALSVPSAITIPLSSMPVEKISSAEHHFVEVAQSTLNGCLAAVAAQLVSARYAGKNDRDLDALYQRSINVVRSDIVDELEAARLGDNHALTRADQQLNDLANVDSAFHQWRSQP